jgi:hypothetical protein
VLEFAAQKMIQVRLVQVGGHSLSDISLCALEIESSSLPDGSYSYVLLLLKYSLPKIIELYIHVHHEKTFVNVTHTVFQIL